MRTHVLRVVSEATQYVAQQQYELAGRLYEELVSLVRRDAVLAVGVLTQLGRCYTLLARYPKARRALRRALTISKRRFGPHHPDTRRCLQNLGVLYEAQGKHAPAQRYFEQVRVLAGHIAGPDGVMGNMPWNASPRFVQALANGASLQ